MKSLVEWEKLLLKNVAIEFFSSSQLENAKTRLAGDLLTLSSDIPRLPVRQGENKSSREVDDIVRLLYYADEHQVMDKLPMYVVNKSSMLPPVSLCEGDLRFLFDKLRRMEETILCHGSCLAKVSTLTESISAQLSAADRVHRQFDVLSHSSTATPGIVYSAAIQSDRATTSRDPITTSFGVSTQPVTTQCGTVVDTSAAKLYSSTVVGKPMSTGVHRGNLFSVLAGGATTDTDKATSDADAGGFTVVESSKTKKIKKRRRVQQSSPVLAMNNEDGGSGNNGETVVNKKKPLVIGCANFVHRSWSSNEQRFHSPIKAAPSAARKKILYVDNLDRDVTVEQLSNFVHSLGAKVLSCFPAQPRKRYRDLRPANDSGVIDRSAFRLGVLESDLAKILDNDLWPSGVVVSEWHFKRNHDIRNKDQPTDRAGADQRDGSVRSSVRSGGDRADSGNLQLSVDMNTSLVDINTSSAVSNLDSHGATTVEMTVEDESDSTVILNSTLISSALESATAGSGSVILSQDTTGHQLITKS